MRWKYNNRGWAFTFKTKFGVRTENTGVHDKKIAQRMARKARVEDLEAARLQSDVLCKVLCGRKVTMDHAIEEWQNSMRRLGHVRDRTLYNHTAYVKAFLRHQKLQHATPNGIRDEHVAGYINAADGTKVSTRRVRLSIIKSFLEYCHGEGWIPGNPARIVKRVSMAGLDFNQKEVKHKVPFTEGEIRALMEYIDAQIAKLMIDFERIDPLLRLSSEIGKQLNGEIQMFEFWKIAITIGRWTGLRFIDVALLEWASLEKPGVVIVWTRKRDKRVELPMNEALSGALAKIVKTDDVYCFPVQRGIYNNFRTRHKFPKQFGKIVVGTGLRDRSFHSLRSAFALDAVDRLIASGRTRDQAVAVVQSLLGHGDSETTENFYLNGNEKEEAV